MGYLDDIFSEVGDAAVEASSAYLDNLVDQIKNPQQETKSPAPIQQVIENNQPAKDYSGMIVVGIGIVSVVAAFLLFKKKSE